MVKSYHPRRGEASYSFYPEKIDGNTLGLPVPAGERYIVFKEGKDYLYSADTIEGVEEAIYLPVRKNVRLEYGLMRREATI